MDIDSERMPTEDDQMDYDEVPGDDDEVMEEDERMDDDMDPEPIAAESPLPVDPPPIQEVDLVSQSTHLTVDPPTLLSQEHPLSSEQDEEVDEEENHHLEQRLEPDAEPDDPEDDTEPVDQQLSPHLIPNAPEMVPSTSRSPRVPPSHFEDEDEEDYPYPTAQALPPILIHLPDSLRSLFAPHEKITWLRGKETDLAEASLADVWTAIRAEMAREGLVKSGELIITEKQMELKMGEDDLNLQTITLLELLQLHHGCGLAPPVRLYISFEPSRFIHRFNAIQQEVSAQARDQESVNGDTSELPSTRNVTTKEEQTRDTPERSLGPEKEDERRNLRPARAEYGGSQRGAPPDSHPNATWANTRPILPMNISGRRIIAEKPLEDETEVVENIPQRRDNDDPQDDRDTETDSSKDFEPRKMPGADEVELKQAGLIDEHGNSVHQVEPTVPKEQFPLSDLEHRPESVDELGDSPDPSLLPVREVPLDEYALRHSDEQHPADPKAELSMQDEPRSSLNELDRSFVRITKTPLDEYALAHPEEQLDRQDPNSGLSPLVSVATTPIATTELFQNDAPTEPVGTPQVEPGYSVLEDVPEETENDQPLSDKLVQSGNEGEEAEEAVKEAEAQVEAAQAEVDKAEEARARAYAVEGVADEEDASDVDELEKDDSIDEGIDVNDDEVDSDEGDDVDDIPDEPIPVPNDIGTPTGPSSPVGSADPAQPVSYDDSAYDSAYDSEGEDGVDEIADSLVKESADSPPVSAPSTLDGEPADEVDPEPPSVFTDSATADAAILSPLRSSDKRAFDEFKRGDDAELVEQLEKRSRGSD